jgi:hypothetical protein
MNTKCFKKIKSIILHNKFIRYISENKLTNKFKYQIKSNMNSLSSGNNLTHSKYEEIFFKIITDLTPLFIEDKTDFTKLENSLNTSGGILKTIKLNYDKMSSNLKKEIRIFFEKIASWIQKNFSSVKLYSVIMLISNFLSALEFEIEISREKITNLLQLETYDQLREATSNGKEEKIKDEEYLAKDSLITNSFLTSFYSLIIAMSNKQEIVVKSKNLLRSVLTVMTQICEIDKIAIYFKKKRIISIFIKILKILRSIQKDNEEYFIQVAKIAMCFFAKIGMKREIYRDYMFKKAVPDLITDIYLQFYMKENNNDLSKNFSVYTFFAIRIVDHKTFFWSKGVINALLKILNKALCEETENEISREKNSNQNTISLTKEKISLIEYLTLALYNLTIDNTEVQSELIDQNYLKLAKEILIKYSNHNFILFNVISSLRRIRDEEYLEKITEELLYTYFALFDYFYLKTKKSLEDCENSSEKFSISTNSFDFIILKELVAILGNIVKDEIHTKPFLEKNLHVVLIDLILSFTTFPKLIKNTIGALINLTNNEEIREEFSRAAAFLNSIYLILDKYKENPSIVDYELKLIINIVKNEFVIKTFISGDMFFYLILFMKNYYEYDEILINVLKIIRNLILKSKIIL